MATFNGSDDYRAWIFTLASAMACVFGAGLIFIDTIVKKILGRDVRILHNHKFLAGSLGLGSGVMIFSSFYNLLPEAKAQLSSELSIFSRHADAALMLFFFSGVGLMGLIHWIMHRFDSGANSPGIENSGAIEQFMQRESASGGRQALSSTLLPHHTNNGTFLNSSKAMGKAGTGPNSAASTSAVQHACDGCVQDESDEDEDEERYNDSEYVDDEVTSLLNNAFLQIGKTPNSQMDDTPHMHQHLHERNGQHHSYNEDDEGSIEIVISDQKDKILRRTVDRASDLDLDLDLDDDNDHDDNDDDDDRHDGQNGGLLKNNRENSWSSVSTRSQKPFAPVNKRRKSGTVPKVKGRKHAKDCTRDHANITATTPAAPPGGAPVSKNHLTKPHQPPSGNNMLSTYGAIPAVSKPILPSPDHGAHLRRTSFPRLKGGNTIYSRHDNLDHAVADDREHADLTEIGIQTALTIAIHKFPEGLITFLSTTADPCLGLSVFMAISVHNLIEGYLIAFPLFIGLHSRTKAFALAAALGGLSQPLGALLGWFILRKVASMGWQVSATGAIYALVAGMMSSIAVNGMWPQAVKCVGRNPTKVVQYSFFGGIAVMGICQAVMGSKCDF